jgi:hypothetical protein
MAVRHVMLDIVNHIGYITAAPLPKGVQGPGGAGAHVFLLLPGSPGSVAGAGTRG